MRMDEAIAFGLSALAAFALAVVLAIYRRATSTDLVERAASLFFASAPSSAQNGNAQ